MHALNTPSLRPVPQLTRSSWKINHSKLYTRVVSTKSGVGKKTPGGGFQCMCMQAPNAWCSHIACTRCTSALVFTVRSVLQAKHARAFLASERKEVLLVACIIAASGTNTSSMHAVCMHKYVCIGAYVYRCVCVVYRCVRVYACVVCVCVYVYMYAWMYTDVSIPVVPECGVAAAGIEPVTAEPVMRLHISPSQTQHTHATHTHNTHTQHTHATHDHCSPGTKSEVHAHVYMCMCTSLCLSCIRLI